MNNPITIVISIVLCLLIGFWAQKLGRSFLGWALVSIITTPLLAAILLLIIQRPAPAKEEKKED